MRRAPFVLTLLAALALRAGAILQVDVADSLIDASCQDQLQAAFVLEGNPALWPATGIFGPDGWPLVYHLIFNYDGTISGGAVQRIDLQAGSVLHSWTPAPWTVIYAPGPSFPVTGVFAPFPACGTALDAPARPAARALEAIRPNPCNPDAVVHLRLARAGQVRLSLHDLQGRRLRTLLAGNRPAGPLTVPVSGADLASGLYLVVLETAGGREAARLLVLK